MDTPLCRVLQVNLRGQKIATKELLLEPSRHKATVALIQEPYIESLERMKDTQEVRIFQNTGQEGGIVKAAIAIFDPSLDVIQHQKLSTNNIVVVEIRASALKITLVSFYFEPKEPMVPYLELLKKIIHKLGPQTTVLGGDPNAKSTWCVECAEDGRGEMLRRAFEEMDLQILNSGTIPTLDNKRGEVRHCVDITACTSDMITLIDSWIVDEGLVSPDHYGIVFCINLVRAKENITEHTTRTTLQEKITQLLSNLNLNPKNKTNSQELEQAVSDYNDIVGKTCQETLQKNKIRKISTMPWWTERLTALMKEVSTKRRRIRNAAPVRRDWVISQYLTQKEMFECEVRKAQVESWKKFCGQQNMEGVFEGIYRLPGKMIREENQFTVHNGYCLEANISAETRSDVLSKEVGQNYDENRKTKEHAKEVDEVPFNNENNE